MVRRKRQEICYTFVKGSHCEWFYAALQRQQILEHCPLSFIQQKFQFEPGTSQGTGVNIYIYIYNHCTTGYPLNVTMSACIFFFSGTRSWTSAFARLQCFPTSKSIFNTTKPCALTLCLYTKEPTPTSCHFKTRELGPTGPWGLSVFTQSYLIPVSVWKCVRAFKIKYSCLPFTPLW